MDNIIDNIKLEPWEEISDSVRDMLPSIISKFYREIPEKPEVGKFYRIYRPNCISDRDQTYHAVLRIGKNPKKVMIFFNGGGVSYNEHTAAYPSNLFTAHQPESYYFNDVEYIGDGALERGIGSSRDENPFKDWTIIDILYGSGDFHAGKGDFPYTALDGSRRILPHHGYRNAMTVIEMAKTWIDEPETLLIGGTSAGGFGVALVADDVIQSFPDCKDITCLVDGSLLVMDDWYHVAKDVWHAPEHIYQRIHSDNIMLDSYEALYRKYGNSIQYLFCCSTRDVLLTMAQNGIDGNGMIVDLESGERFMSRLKITCEQIVEKIPPIGLYIYDMPADIPGFEETLTTKHCEIDSTCMFDYVEEGKTPCEWLINALEGKVEQIGLHLIKK